MYQGEIEVGEFKVWVKCDCPLEFAKIMKKLGPKVRKLQRRRKKTA